jgi:UMF1 family MFS transporter
VEHAPLPFAKAFKTGATQIWHMLRDIKSHKNIALFLVASAIYRDGLVTLFAIGGVYAAGQYGMDFAEILIFAIGLNVFSGLGAFVFGWLDDYLGSKPTIMISLMGLIAFGVSVLFVHDQSMFTILAFGMGFFIGPVQAASRTLAGRLAPHGMMTQTYGLYAFTGKSIAFMGPVAYGLATQAFGTQQAGMMSIVLFWVVGLVLLAWVREGADD